MMFVYARFMREKYDRRDGLHHHVQKSWYGREGLAMFLIWTATELPLCTAALWLVPFALLSHLPDFATGLILIGVVPCAGMTQAWRHSRSQVASR